MSDEAHSFIARRTVDPRGESFATRVLPWAGARAAVVSSIEVHARLKRPLLNASRSADKVRSPAIIVLGISIEQAS